MKATPQNCTVSIPTNSRPDSLRGCLKAIQHNISSDIQVHVINSTPKNAPQPVHDAYAKLFAEYPDVDVYHYGENVPPGKSRRILSEHCDSPFILFMDDDHEICPGTFDSLAAAQENHALDIVSGRWIDDSRERSIGFLYIDGWIHGQATIHKLPLQYRSELKEHVFITHDVLATMLCRSEIFSYVNFDDRYSFYFELFDFFESCRKSGIKVGVIPSATFIHRPTSYLAESSRQKQVREQDEARFREKWGMIPIQHRLPRLDNKAHLRTRIANWFRKLGK